MRQLRCAEGSATTAVMPTRRQFLFGVAATGLLVACGNSDDGVTETAGRRTVTTDNGPLHVPAVPERVVAAIGSFETDMVAVGFMPVLTSSFAGPWVELDDSVTITEDIPPTPEELLAVRPDLVMGWSWVTQEPTFDELTQIAPYAGLGETAATAGPGFDGSQPMRSWDTLFLSVCEVLGKRREGEALVAAFERRLDDLRERRSNEPATRVARIEFHEAGSFSYRGQNEDTAELMRRIGLTVVGPTDTVNDESLERLPDIDGGCPTWAPDCGCTATTRAGSTGSRTARSRWTSWPTTPRPSIPTLWSWPTRPRSPSASPIPWWRRSLPSSRRCADAPPTGCEGYGERWPTRSRVPRCE